MEGRMDLETLVLEKGAHTFRAKGMCLMEAVAHFACEGHTDRPNCVSPALAAFGRSLNDALTHDRRQSLKVLIPRLVGTNDGRDEDCIYLALDWLIRQCVPAWLDLVGIDSSDLRGAGRVECLDDALALSSTLQDAQNRTSIAWALALTSIIRFSDRDTMRTSAIDSADTVMQESVSAGASHLIQRLGPSVQEIWEDIHDIIWDIAVTIFITNEISPIDLQQHIDALQTSATELFVSMISIER